MTAVAENHLSESAKGSSRIIYLVGLVFVLFLGWAAISWVDEIVRAEGEIVSSSRAQTVQNLEGGILAELKVRQATRSRPGRFWRACRTPNSGLSSMICRIRSTRWKSSVCG